MNDKWVTLQPQEGVEETLSHFVNYQGECVGWCLVCDEPITSETNMIPGSNSHDCPKNRLALSNVFIAER